MWTKDRLPVDEGHRGEGRQRWPTTTIIQHLRYPRWPSPSPPHATCTGAWSVHRNSLTVSSPLDMLPPRAQALCCCRWAPTKHPDDRTHVFRHAAARAARARRLHDRTAALDFDCGECPPGASRSPLVCPPSRWPPQRRHSRERRTSDARLRTHFAGSGTNLGAHSISRHATASIRVRAPAALGSLSAAIQPSACDADSPHT